MWYITQKVLQGDNRLKRSKNYIMYEFSLDVVHFSQDEILIFVVIFLSVLTADTGEGSQTI